MSKVDFEWQVGGESGEWETIAELRKRTRNKWSWRIWVIIVTVAIVIAAIAYVYLRQQFEEANQQITFQIKDVIDLETRAWNRGEVDLYLRQQDDLNLDWYAQQSRLVNASSTLVNASSTQDNLDEMPAVQIQEVNVQGDIAWVETIEGNDPVRRMRFYRQTSRGWLHTAPDPRFWDQAIEYHYGDQVVFRYHQRDQPYVDPLIEQLGEAFYDICTTVNCKDVFEIDFSINLPAKDAAPERTVIIVSPWTSGIPLGNEWSEAYIEPALYDLASKILRSRFAAPPPALNALTSAIIDEYAAWTSTGDLTQAPLLGRIIARQGKDVLPELFASLDRPPTLSAFLSRWLFFSPTNQARAIIFFEMMLNIEQEAFLTARRETFLLLQDAKDPMWVSHQQYIFDRVSDLERAALAFPPVEIETMIRYQDYVVVTSTLPDALRSRSVTVFTFRNRDWKHNDFASPSTQVPSLPTATPGPES